MADAALARHGLDRLASGSPAQGSESAVAGRSAGPGLVWTAQADALAVLRSEHNDRLERLLDTLDAG